MRPHEEWLEIKKKLDKVKESYINEPISNSMLEHLKNDLKIVFYTAEDEVFHEMGKELTVEFNALGDIFLFYPKYNDILRRRHLVCTKKY